MKEETILLLIDETAKQIQIETQKYKDVITNNRPFSEAKQVRLKIKQLTAELTLLLSQKELQGKVSNAEQA